MYTLQKWISLLTLAAAGEGPVEPERICLVGEEGAIGILDLQAQLGSARANLFCCRPGGRAAGDFYLKRTTFCFCFFFIPHHQTNQITLIFNLELI